MRLLLGRRHLKPQSFVFFVSVLGVCFSGEYGRDDAGSSCSPCLGRPCPSLTEKTCVASRDASLLGNLGRYPPQSTCAYCFKTKPVLGHFRTKTAFRAVCQAKGDPNQHSNRASTTPGLWLKCGWVWLRSPFGCILLAKAYFRGHHGQKRARLWQKSQEP